MKCPRCGHDMTPDTHRKYPLQMCYNCGYSVDPYKNGESPAAAVNFSYIKTLGEEDLAAYMAKGLGVDEKTLLAWLKDTAV